MRKDEKTCVDMGPKKGECLRTGQLDKDSGGIFFYGLFRPCRKHRRKLPPQQHKNSSPAPAATSNPSAAFMSSALLWENSRQCLANNEIHGKLAPSEKLQLVHVRILAYLCCASGGGCTHQPPVLFFKSRCNAWPVLSKSSALFSSSCRPCNYRSVQFVLSCICESYMLL